MLTAALSACSAKPAAPTPVPFPTLDPNTAEGRGYALFSGKGRCATCHSLSEGTVIVGPSLAKIAITAVSRRPNYTAQDYLEESILLPDEFKVPGFEDKQMDVTLAKTLSTDEISDIVAFLMTLR